MGDLVGEAVEGTLYYIPYREFERVRAAKLAPKQRVGLFSDMCRLNALYMIARAGSGHIGSSFSSMDIFSWLLLQELDLARDAKADGDLFFSSKGHDAPGYYAVLMGLGRLPFENVHKLRRIDGLPGHPDIGTPGIVTNTGSLGMGVSKAKGMILANRLQGRKGRVVVMTGDGELQEGQFWESLVSAANHKLHELLVVIDHNKLQSDTFVKNVSDLGDLEAKLMAFGWRVARCDGHDLDALSATLREVRDDPRPKVIIADTVKGKGVSFMEHTSLDSDVAMYRFHSGAPDANSYRLAAQEIMARLRTMVDASGLGRLETETAQRDATAPAPASVQRLIPAYTSALIAQAEKNPGLIALDADLVLDTGLIPFREKFPDRFVECGIAEQDMVSIAGGMALRGALPVVHSFACFLSARPNEQIYNNATEKTRIVYVASLAGVIPGGPGHSHQAIRDISALAGVPGLAMMEPSCEAEVPLLLDWCVRQAPGSSYLRLTSLPWEVPYELPGGYSPRFGEGVILTEGSEVAVFGYGPVLLSNAWQGAKAAEKMGVRARVINLPWLNHVNSGWLEKALQGCKRVVSLDNHYATGGQGDVLARALASIGGNLQFEHLAVRDIPPSGTNPQVLDAVGLSAQAIHQAILGMRREGR